MREPSGPISVVVPVYGDGRALAELAARLERVLAPHAAWELILVNDGSPPPVWDHIRDLATAHPCIKAIDLQQNAGQHSALLAGIRASSGDVIVTIDDDLQHPPEAIPALLRCFDDARVDVVYGTPLESAHGLRRQAGARLVRRMVALLSGVPQARVVSAFRVFRGTFRAPFAAHEGARVFIDGVLCRGSGKVTAVAVRHEPRRHGHSGYGLRRLVSTAVDMTMAFGIPRLRVACLLAAGGFTVAAGVAVERRAPGHRTLATPLSGVAFVLGSLFAAAGFACIALTGISGGRGRGSSYVVRTSIKLEHPESARGLQRSARSLRSHVVEPPMEGVSGTTDAQPNAEPGVQ